MELELFVKKRHNIDLYHSIVLQIDGFIVEYAVNMKLNPLKKWEIHVLDSNFKFMGFYAVIC